MRRWVEIPLVNTALFALVDESDEERVRLFSWSANLRTMGLRYAQRAITLPSGKTSTQSLHRFVVSAAAGQIVDHVNGDGFDNRRENLRFCSASQNSQNRKRSAASRNGGFKGVARVKKGGWTAQLRGPGMRELGKRGYIGFYKTLEEAALAYDRRAAEVFGEFASFNFPAHRNHDFVCDESKALRLELTALRARLARVEGGA